jgi:hypothetical protein
VRLLALSCLTVLPVFSQIIIDDFKCLPGVTLTAGNPTIVTCSAGHGYENMSASTYYTSSGAANNNTMVIGGVTWTMKTAINNANPREILIGADAFNTMKNIVDAVNDTGSGKGTTYSNATTACANCFALNANSTSGSYWIFAKTAGVGGESITTTGTGNIGATTATMKIQFGVIVTGATGAWAAIGSDATAKQYVNPATGTGLAHYLSTTTFSIPFDSTGITWDSQAGIFVRRASITDANELFNTFEDQGWATTGIYTANGLAVTNPSCTDTTDDAGCSKGFMKPENQKNYLCAGSTPISSFVVLGSVITVETLSLWTDCGSYPTLAVGQLVWIRGGFAYTTATNPNSFAAQTAAQAISANAGANNCLPVNITDPSNPAGTTPTATCRGFVIQTKTTAGGGTRTQVTLKNNGLVDGSYTLTCADTHCPTFSDAAGHMYVTWWSSPYVYMNTRSGGFFQPGFGAMGYSKYNPYSEVIANPTAVNRFRTYSKSSINADYDPSADDFQLGTYTSEQGRQAGTDQVHYYHDFSGRWYQNQWTLIEATGTPSHCVCESGNGMWPNNETLGHPYSSFAGAGSPGWSYWYGMGNFYLDGPGYIARYAGFSPTFKRYELDTVLNEPDEWVPNRLATWGSSRYISAVLTANQGYEASWVLAHGLTGVTYQVRYSTTGSLKSAGFSTGLCKSGTSTCSGADTVSPTGSYIYLWQSATLAAPSPTTWIAIRPIMPITWAASTGLAYWVGSDLDPMMTSGDKVTISLNGNTQTNVATTGVKARQSWYLKVPSDNANWTGTGQLTSIVAASSVCTANLTANHNLVAGWKIKVLGTSSAALGNTGYDFGSVNYVVTATPTSTTFTFACPGVADATYNTDPGTGIHMAIMSFPGVLVAGTSPGFASSGTLQSTEDLKNFTELTYTPPSVALASSGGSVMSGGVVRSGVTQ